MEDGHLIVYRMYPPKLPCRVVITYNKPGMFDLGMFDPVGERYEPLGTHPIGKIEKVVGDLRDRMEQERYLVSFSEVRGPR